MACFKQTAVFLVCLLTLGGCVAPQPKTSADLNTQEDILLKSKNYTGLINLYRGWLKDKDEPGIRLKLSRYYYQAGDYKSSLYYLQPLSTKADLNVYTLQAQNMIALGDYSQAIRVTDRMLQHDSQNAEAWNLRGIALALSGKLQEGGQAIQKSRDLFIADDVAINNLAMVALLDRRYQDAVSLLLPQYLRGRRQPRLLHNLVLALVKVGDTRYARDIIQSESLSDYPNELIDALERTGPLQKGVA
ncbi:Flp pilus assembly protein TadD [Paramixta manurensis]|uniref:Flp pilus assembly protein TadD n=1 Tax=Paramixta manurensis TaxID=2740817 RepID=A0A6M8UNX2_9GAMM|nr:Flp pilus assembly protein TadD [Erwiniaceae bacterium PD-1]